MLWFHDLLQIFVCIMSLIAELHYPVHQDGLPSYGARETSGINSFVNGVPGKPTSQPPRRVSSSTIFVLFSSFLLLAEKNLVTDNNLIETFCESKHMLESAEVSFASLADTEMGQNHK